MGRLQTIDIEQLDGVTGGIVEHRVYGTDGSIVEIYTPAGMALMGSRGVLVRPDKSVVKLNNY
jgi:hypothetical protein